MIIKWKPFIVISAFTNKCKVNIKKLHYERSGLVKHIFKKLIIFLKPK